MSQIQNVITTTFRAQGTQAIAAMGQLSGGLQRFGQQVNNATRMSERLNNQWRAIGTTIRYAVAGQAVFGLTRLVGQLRDVQVQMGLISAIGQVQGPGGAGIDITGNRLSQLMSDARQGAVESITPFQDYNAAIINLLSTVDKIPQDQITPMVTTISRAAQLAQVSAEDATKAFTTMNVAFGRKTNLKNVQDMAQQFFILTREAPGGVAAGQQVINQLGQLAQVTRAARGRPQDMFALLLSTLRAGIPPAQAGRGLQYLIQTVAFPGQQVAESRAALASVGITPTANMTLQQRLAAIFGRARQLGVRGDISRLSRLDEDTLSEMEAAGGTEAGLQQLGISGRGAQFLGTIFRRIHALRTALAIQGQLDVGQAQKDLKETNDAMQGHVSDINDLNKAWTRFHKQARLQEASVALGTMGLQIAETFAPVLNFAAGKITGGVQMLQRHQTATKIGTWGAAGFLAALGIGRALGAGDLPGVRRIPGLRGLLGGGGVGRGFVLTQAAQAAVSGNATLGATPQNPLFVIVVGEIFGGGTAGPGGGVVGGEGKVPKVVPWWGRGLRAVGRTGRGVLGLGEIPIGAATGWTMAGMGLFGAAWAAAQRNEKGELRWSPTGRPYFNIGQHAVALTRGLERKEELRRAQQMFRGAGDIAGIERYRVGKLQGRAEVYMTLDINQNGKVTRKKVHVPLEMWANGKTPSSKGKPKSKRGN